jgi:hypothetical protein
MALVSLPKLTGTGFCHVRIYFGVRSDSDGGGGVGMGMISPVKLLGLIELHFRVEASQNRPVGNE